jgi:hypothetical protein
MNAAALRMPPTPAAVLPAAARITTEQLAAAAAAENAALWEMLWQLTALVCTRRDGCEPDDFGPLSERLQMARQAIRTLTKWVPMLRPCVNCDCDAIPWDAPADERLCPRCSYEAEEAGRDPGTHPYEDDGHNSGCWSYRW